jgi:hypothetical protein
MTCIHPGCTEERFSATGQYCHEHRRSIWQRRRTKEQAGAPMQKNCATCGNIFTLTAPNQKFCPGHAPPPRKDRPPKLTRPFRKPKNAPVVVRHLPPEQRRISELLRAWR